MKFNNKKVKDLPIFDDELPIEYKNSSKTLKFTKTELNKIVNSWYKKDYSTFETCSDNLIYTFFKVMPWHAQQVIKKSLISEHIINIALGVLNGKSFCRK